LDRALLYHSQIINWTHGRRGYPEVNRDMLQPKTEKKGFTASFDSKSKQICNVFFRTMQKDDYGSGETAKKQLFKVIRHFLEKQT